MSISFSSMRITVILVTVSVLYAIPGGYQGTVTNTVQPTLQKFVGETLNIPIDSTTISFVMSSITAGYSFGAIFGCSAASVLGERLGPLKALSLVVAPIYLITSILMGVSAVTKQVYLLAITRIAFGFGGGLNNVLTHVYVAECSPSNRRGLFYTILKVVISFGNLLAQIMGMEAVLGTMESLPYLLGLMVIFGLFGLFGTCFCPESPGHYLKQHKGLRARDSAARLVGQSIDNAEVESLLDGILAKQKMQEENTKHVPLEWKVIFSEKKYRTPFIMTLILNLSAIVTGNAAQTYSTEIFLSYGLLESSSQYLTVAIYVVADLSYFCTIPLVQKINRRPLFIIGLAAILPCLVVLVFIPYFQLHFIKITIAVACWLLVVFMRNSTVGPLRSLVPLEICQTELRIKAFSLSMVLLRTGQTLSLFIIYPLFTAIGSWIFLIFALLTGMMIAYVTLKMPETRNKTFVEISMQWEPRKGKHGYGSLLSTSSDDNA